MGWLRTLMAEASPPVASYGELARRALAHPDWPDDTRPQPRSLAALFSKLDRDQELEWLGDRPAARQAIADVLGTTPAALEQDFADVLTTSDVTRSRIRLDDVPFARIIDLATEGLPPGLPDVVLQPPRWNRVLWQAPGGSGRSLVGRWLEARGLATFIEATSPSDVSARLAQSGPVFIEVPSPSDVDAIIAAPPRAPVCVAGPYDAGAGRAAQLGFSLVTSPPPETFVEPLVSWLELRLPTDDHFESPAVLALLRHWIDAGSCHTLGDLLGLAGVVDELGTREVTRWAPAELARRFVSQKLDGVTPADSARPTWHDRGFEVLVSLSKSSLTDSSAEWGTPRSITEWARLVPEELQRSVDPEWLRLSMAPHATSATLKELERALRRLPPGGFQVVRALEAAGLLRRATRAGDLGLAPRWLASVVGEHALREITKGSPFEWGEGLLEPSSAATVQRRIDSRAADDADALIEDLLELGGAASPAYAAAVESVVRAVGVGMLTDAIEPPEALAALWDAAVELVVQVDGAPHPRIGMPDASEPMLSRGVHHVAMLAISEALAPGTGRRHAQLRPWLVAPRDEAMTPVLDAILEALADGAVRRRLAGPVGALLARIPQTATGPRPEPPHPLLRPARWLSRTSPHNAWHDLVEMLGDPPLTAMLEAVSNQTGRSWESVTEMVFHTWQQDSYSHGTTLAAAANECPALWRHVPRSILSTAIESGALPLDVVPWAALASATRMALVMAHLDRVPPDAWTACAPTELTAILEQSVPIGPAAQSLWHHDPEACFDALDTRSANASARLAQFAMAAPPTVAPRLIEVLNTLPTTTLEPIDLRQALHEFVRRRTPGWRNAYELLVSLERAKERARSHAP